MIDPQQIAAVEIEVAALEDVTQPLLLCLRLVLRVPHERSESSDLGHQQPRLPWREKNTRSEFDRLKYERFICD